jgi:hypothetical protein
MIRFYRIATSRSPGLIPVRNEFGWSFVINMHWIDLPHLNGLCNAQFVSLGEDESSRSFAPRTAALVSSSGNQSFLPFLPITI